MPYLYFQYSNHRIAFYIYLNVCEILEDITFHFRIPSDYFIYNLDYGAWVTGQEAWI